MDSVSSEPTPPNTASKDLETGLSDQQTQTLQADGHAPLGARPHP